MQDSIKVIDPSVRVVAANLIRRQTGVPVSPLRRLQDGTVEFCAAAALVVAATPSQSQREALIARFEKSGRESVVEAFSGLGWPRELGMKMLQTNDAFDEDKRKSGVLAIFEER